MFGLVGWHALFLLADLRVRVFAAFLGAYLGFNATAVFLSGAPTAAESAVMGITAISTCGLDRVRIEYANVGRPARTKASLVARAIQDGLIDVNDL
ncbi:hypothetical protein QQY66_25140 [Streptomyces sp. DG2A-72]|uniref:hypothetical protein n=1 Tax=Streptomyces sp. DG2A-72 TaxID=3051386 RepID=UPI00265BD26B|nr:hypothetical protein [Streptomyces sp. DG2A-72]MDO0934804.1 hypothetical protein [Streptomyces sp. DG2A-72]